MKSISNTRKPKLLNWTITPWQMDGKGGWEIEPIILVQGRIPFYADHPQAYIDKLLELHDDPALLRLQTLYTRIGEFQDALEYFWNVEKSNGTNGSNTNGGWPSAERHRARDRS